MPPRWPPPCPTLQSARQPDVASADWSCSAWAHVRLQVADRRGVPAPWRGRRGHRLDEAFSAVRYLLARYRRHRRSPCTRLLLARDGEGGPIVGTLTLALFRIPTGVRAWMEDVIVAAEVQGRGCGEVLTRAALEIAASCGARTVELTSRPSRQAANANSTRGWDST